MRSKHGDDIVSDDRIRNDQATEFTETQIIPWDSTWKVPETLSFFSFNSNNDENKFLSLAYERRNNIVILDKFDANGVCLWRKMLLSTERLL